MSTYDFTSASDVNYCLYQFFKHAVLPVRYLPTSLGYIYITILRFIFIPIARFALWIYSLSATCFGTTFVGGMVALYCLILHSQQKCKYASPQNQAENEEEKKGEQQDTNWCFCNLDPFQTFYNFYGCLINKWKCRKQPSFDSCDDLREQIHDLTVTKQELEEQLERKMKESQCAQTWKDINNAALLLQGDVKNDRDALRGRIKFEKTLLKDYDKNKYLLYDSVSTRKVGRRKNDEVDDSSTESSMQRRRIRSSQSDVSNTGSKERKSSSKCTLEGGQSFIDKSNRKAQGRKLGSRTDDDIITETEDSRSARDRLWSRKRLTVNEEDQTTDVTSTHLTREDQIRDEIQAGRKKHRKLSSQDRDEQLFGQKQIFQAYLSDKDEHTDNQQHGGRIFTDREVVDGKYSYKERVSYEDEQAIDNKLTSKTLLHEGNIDAEHIRVRIVDSRHTDNLQERLVDQNRTFQAHLLGRNDSQKRIVHDYRDDKAIDRRRRSGEDFAYDEKGSSIVQKETLQDYLPKRDDMVDQKCSAHFPSTDDRDDGRSLDRTSSFRKNLGYDKEDQALNNTQISRDYSSNRDDMTDQKRSARFPLTNDRDDGRSLDRTLSSRKHLVRDEEERIIDITQISQGYLPDDMVDQKRSARVSSVVDDRPVEIKRSTEERLAYDENKHVTGGKQPSQVCLSDRDDKVEQKLSERFPSTYGQEGVNRKRKLEDRFSHDEDVKSVKQTISKISGTDDTTVEELTNLQVLRTDNSRELQLKQRAQRDDENEDKRRSPPSDDVKVTERKGSQSTYYINGRDRRMAKEQPSENSRLIDLAGDGSMDTEQSSENRVTSRDPSAVEKEQRFQSYLVDDKPDLQIEKKRTLKEQKDLSDDERGRSVRRRFLSGNQEERVYEEKMSPKINHPGLRKELLDRRHSPPPSGKPDGRMIDQRRPSSLSQDDWNEHFVNRSLDDRKKMVAQKKIDSKTYLREELQKDTSEKDQDLPEKSKSYVKRQQSGRIPYSDQTDEDSIDRQGARSAMHAGRKRERDVDRVRSQSSHLPDLQDGHNLKKRSSWNRFTDNEKEDYARQYSPAKYPIEMEIRSPIRKKIDRERTEGFNHKKQKPSRREESKEYVLKDKKTADETARKTQGNIGILKSNVFNSDTKAKKTASPASVTFESLKSSLEELEDDQRKIMNNLSKSLAKSSSRSALASKVLSTQSLLDQSGSNRTDFSQLKTPKEYLDIFLENRRKSPIQEKLSDEDKKEQMLREKGKFVQEGQRRDKLFQEGSGRSKLTPEAEKVQISSSKDYMASEDAYMPISKKFTQDKKKLIALEDENDFLRQLIEEINIRHKNINERTLRTSKLLKDIRRSSRSEQRPSRPNQMPILARSKPLVASDFESNYLNLTNRLRGVISNAKMKLLKVENVLKNLNNPSSSPKQCAYELVVKCPVSLCPVKQSLSMFPVKRSRKFYSRSKCSKSGRLCRSQSPVTRYSSSRHCVSSSPSRSSMSNSSRHCQSTSSARSPSVARQCRSNKSSTSTKARQNGNI